MKYPPRTGDPIKYIEDRRASFGVKPGDKLYVPPDQRVRIW